MRVPLRGFLSLPRLWWRRNQNPRLLPCLLAVWAVWVTWITSLSQGCFAKAAFLERRPSFFYDRPHRCKKPRSLSNDNLGRRLYISDLGGKADFSRGLLTLGKDYLALVFAAC